MKNRGVLSLMEQAIMLVVFALAAVLCLRAFVWADTTSKESAARDQALIQLQNAAEVLKGCAGDGEAAAERYGGTWDGQSWVIRYDEQWRQSTDGGKYRLEARPDTKGTDGLGTARIRVYRDETCLVDWARHVAWQEVTADG